MKNLFLFYHLFYIFQKSQCLQAQDFTLIINSLKFSGITIFLKNKLAKNLHENSFFQNVFSRSPTVLIDIENYVTSKILVLNHSTVCLIILKDEVSWNEAKSTLELLIDISPSEPRPKCLLMFWYPSI